MKALKFARMIGFLAVQRTTPRRAFAESLLFFKILNELQNDPALA
jgi:hypothetical protein